MSKHTLLIIDPQVDFCHPQGSLYVPNAEQDMHRLNDFIQTHRDRLSEIHITLDSHARLDIAHPLFWMDENGNPPAPFTQVTAEEVRQGKWKTVHPENQDSAQTYLNALDESGRYPHIIWPEHCLLGTLGHTVDAHLLEGLKNWESHHRHDVQYILKGLNPLTEHFSAVQAEVVDESDPHTQVDTQWIAQLEEADTIWVAGEASSHCVAHTVRDLLKHFSSVDSAKKVALLTDTMSPVGGFEDFESRFFEEVQAQGVRLTTTKDVAQTLA